MTAEELEGLTLPELIEQLADIAAPPPVSYAPETMGWWVVAALLALGLAIAATIVLRRRPRGAACHRIQIWLGNVERCCLPVATYGAGGFSP